MKKIISLIIILSLFSIILSVSVKAGNYRVITVDGEVSDWEGINPAAVEGDPALFPDVNALYLANDADCLYLRFDLPYYAPPNGIPTDERVGNVSIYFDVDLDWTNGYDFEHFDLYPSEMTGDAALTDGGPGYNPRIWNFTSARLSPQTWFWANIYEPNGVQRTLAIYSDYAILEYAIPLEALDVRNEYNQIRLASPNIINQESSPVEWITYDLELETVLVSLQVARYKGTPISYSNEFQSTENVNYKLIIQNINLTSIEVEINEVKILQLGDGNIDYEEQIPAEYIINGSNQIVLTPKGQPETIAIIKIVTN